jgi:hypothetical protein
VEILLLIILNDIPSRSGMKALNILQRIVIENKGQINPYSAVCICVFSKIAWRGDEQGRVDMDSHEA